MEEAKHRISISTLKVKREHLEHWLCLTATRGRRTDKQSQRELSFTH